MVEDYSLENLTEMWTSFFKEHGYAPRLLDVASQYPDVRSLPITYTDVALFNVELAEHLLEQPTASLMAADKASQQMIPPGQRVPVHIRITELPMDPDIGRVPIRDLRAKHLGRLIACEGLVRKSTEVRPRLRLAVFQCMRCGALHRMDQDTLQLKEPLECYKENNGCSRAAGSTKFRLITNIASLPDPFSAAFGDRAMDFSEFEDTQKIEVQESPEGLRGGDQPQRLTCYLEDDLTGKLSPGDRVTLNGILRENLKSQGSQKSTLFEIFLSVVSFERKKDDYDEIVITEADEERIIATSKDPALFPNMIASIAPTIFGMEPEKEGLALQLFGGVVKVLPDKTRIRGDIHIMLVGDPGTAKSQLLRYMTNLAPRAIYTSGKASTAAGLTAAAVRDEFGEGRWTLEAGALVLADQGLAAIDELDKMSEQDRSAMHEAMEQQSISIAKAGITATLQARCAILGAANPKLGRFHEHALMVEQIDLPPALFSRFDVIFSIIDKPDSVWDAKLADHILKVHRTGEVHRLKEYLDGLPLPDGIIEDDLMSVEPIYEPEFVSKYVAYAKSRIFPVLTDEALNDIKDYYITIRKRGEGEEASVPLTARQLEAFIRLAEASARVRLSDYVTKEDADRAIRIVDYFLTKIMGGERFDIDVIATGISHSQRERMRILLDIIDQLARGGESPSEDDIIAEAEGFKIDRAQAKSVLDRLVSDGRIYSPKAGRYRVI
jgi:replicative DNA helicase Mcm